MNEFNFGEAFFGYVPRSPGWFGKVLIGSLCTFLSWLIIPSWILYGYMIQISRGVRSGDDTLPAWDRVAANLVDGLLYNIALFIYGIPAVVLILVGVAVSGCSGSGQPGAAVSCSNGGGFALLIALGVLYSVVVIVVHPAIYAQFVTGGFGAAFDVGEIFARAGRRFGLTLLMLLVGIFAAVLAVIGLVGLFIGVLLTAPYAQYALGHAYGQYTRLTDPSAAAAGSTGSTPATPTT